jgi:hypothetical protein
MKNMVYTFVGNLVVMVHNKNAPSDEELGKYLQELGKRDPIKTPILVLTDGGGLSAKQRKELTSVLDGREQMCAVISELGMVRGVVTALSWFNGRIKSFSTKEIEAAFAYLKVPRQDYLAVWKAIDSLRVELGVTPVARV